MIPTDTPGVTRRPFVHRLRDDHDFNEVFFEGVRVPAENLIGELNDGWTVANGSLGHERTLLWLMLSPTVRGSAADFRPGTPLEKDRYATS